MTIMKKLIRNSAGSQLQFQIYHIYNDLLWCMEVLYGKVLPTQISSLFLSRRQNSCRFIVTSKV